MPTSPWLTITNDCYTLHYCRQFQHDTPTIQAMLNAAVEAMIDEFAAYDAQRLLKNTICHVYLHASPNANANVGLASMRTYALDGRYTAEMHMLTPSALPLNSSLTTNVGEPFDESYCFKTIVHEYSIVILDQLTRVKARGWTFYMAPPWFCEGYEEYLGLTRSSPHSRTVTLERYKQIVMADPQRVRLQSHTGSHTLEVADNYIDGAVLLLFMHETFGQKQVQAILRDEAATFREAFTNALGVAVNEFYDLWRAWRDREANQLMICDKLHR
jgi:hypothetical protein